MNFTTDICIVGAGSAALYMALEATSDNIKCHILETEPVAHYDATETVLTEYLKTTLSEYVPFCLSGDFFRKVDRQSDGQYLVTTSRGDDISCKYVVFSNDGRYLG